MTNFKRNKGNKWEEITNGSHLLTKSCKWKQLYHNHVFSGCIQRHTARDKPSSLAKLKHNSSTLFFILRRRLLSKKGGCQLVIIKFYFSAITTVILRNEHACAQCAVDKIRELLKTNLFGHNEQKSVMHAQKKLQGWQYHFYIFFVHFKLDKKSGRKTIFKKIEKV